MDYLALIGLVGFPVALIITQERSLRHMLEGRLRQLGVRGTESKVKAAFRTDSAGFWSNLAFVAFYEAGLLILAASSSLPRMVSYALLAVCGVGFVAAFVARLISGLRIYGAMERAAKARA